MSIFLLKRRFMHSFQRSITTQYGNKLGGAPADSTLNLVIFYRDVFEPVLSKVIWNIVEEGDICVDAGANVGYFTLLMAQKAGRTGKVISIEAAAGNAAHLIQNVKLNNFEDRVHVINAACSDFASALTFYLNSNNDMVCRLERPKKGEVDYNFFDNNWQSTVVRADRLSALVGADAPNVSFIKLDVEGTEHKLSKDILESFTSSRLCVAIEAKQPNIRKTLEPFEKAGFFAYDLHNDYLWMIKDRIMPATRVSFEELYAKKQMVDVFLSRRQIPVERLN
ncbi:MAG: FkbM family methyltransferase [Acidobacteriia bacterium]|nr:FkbM family methyltransferase [Terriglobia bacterium]